MRKDAYYFSHDSNAKDDPKCVMLIEQLGLEGYGIFWILVETLRDQPDYKYPLSLLPAIARRYNSTTQKVEAVVKGYGLFQTTEDEFFFSLSLMGRMESLDYKKELASIAGKKSAEKRRLLQLESENSTDVERTLNDRTNDGSTIREEKSKEDKIKVNKIKYADRVSMLIEEYEKLVTQYSKDIIDNKIIDLDLWKGSKGKNTKSDYLTLLSWLRKDNPIIVAKNKGTKELKW